MTNPNDGGPAFPPPMVEGEELKFTSALETGMTLRDYFAAHIAVGQANHWRDPNRIAFEAYAGADSMLEERDKVRS